MRRIIPVLLFPEHVQLKGAFGGAGEAGLLEFFDRQKITLEAVRWDGKLESIPTRWRVMVRASDRLKYTWAELAKKCDPLEYFLFHNNKLVTAAGTEEQEGFMRELIRFLALPRPTHPYAEIETVLKFVDRMLATAEPFPGGEIPEGVQRAANSHLLTGLRHLMGDLSYRRFEPRYRERCPGFTNNALGSMRVDLLVPVLEAVMSG